MANTYYKLLSKKIEDEKRNSIMSEIHGNLGRMRTQLNENIFEIFDNNKNKQYISDLLKYYLCNQILKDYSYLADSNSSDKNLEKTSNPNILKDRLNGKYIQKTKTITNNEIIIDVQQDGSYITSEAIMNSSYKTHKLYDAENKLISIQVYNSNNVIVENKYSVIKLLGLKKECVERYKYTGFSGESENLIISVLNKIAPTKETGYYMDTKYNLFFWDSSRYVFTKIRDYEELSPLLTDYDFRGDNIVIRKEFTGRN